MELNKQAQEFLVFDKLNDSAQKEINKGHSTRFKENKRMTYLDEVLEQKDTENITDRQKLDILIGDLQSYCAQKELGLMQMRRNPVITYSRKAQKETENKVDYSEIDWQFIEQLAKRMNKNKGKYPVNNWKKFSDVNELQQALLRHTLEVLNGNYADDDSEFGHLEAIALNAQFINYQLKNK